MTKDLVRIFPENNEPYINDLKETTIKNPIKKMEMLFQKKLEKI